MFDAIPAEVKSCPQWLLWRSVWNAQRNKWDKIPLSPVTGHKCDVTSHASWCSFEQALNSYKAHWDASLGLGFVLGYNSGIVGIDLDNVLDSSGRTVNEDHFRIADAFNSYTELSPSGTGLHVLTKGLLPGGRRHDGVELYGQGRFFTMTGRSFGAPRPLAERQPQIDYLVAHIDSQRVKGVAANLDWTKDGKLGDLELYEMASNASNGEKFLSLWHGQWQGLYTSQSEADYALINMLGFYSDAPGQIARMFHTSALGKRDKAQVQGYVGGMIAHSQDRKPPLVEIPPIPPVTSSIATSQPSFTDAPAFDAEEAEYLVAEADRAFQPPEGFVKTLADWFFAQSMYPMPEIAVVGALGLMAGICGRQYQFQRQGLNLYMLVLAETGAGKDSLSLGMSRIFNAVCNPQPTYVATNGAVDVGFPGARDFEGPSKLTGAGILRDIASSSSLSLVSVLPEFSQTMSAMADPRANDGLKAFQQVLLEFYTKSAEGATFSGSKNSDKTKDIAQLTSPAFTMLCEGTPARFYQSLSETLVTDGLMSRFIVIEHKGYPEHNPTHTQFSQVPDVVKHGVSMLAQHVMQLRSNGDPRIHVGTTAEADAYSEELRSMYRQRGMAAHNEVHKFLWFRAHQNLTRMAALLAIGVNMYQPEVTRAQLEWANRIMFRQVTLIVGKFRRGETGTKTNEDDEQYKILTEFVEKWLGMSADQMRGMKNKNHHEARAAGLVPYNFLQARASQTATFKKDRRGATLALRTAIDNAVRAGMLERVKMQNSTGEFYRPHL